MKMLHIIKHLKPHLSTLKLSVVILLTLFTALTFFYYLFLSYYQDRIYPGVKIANFSVGGKTPIQSINEISSSHQTLLQPLTLNYQDQIFEVDLESAQPQLNLNPAINQAYLVGRGNNIAINFKQQFEALSNLQTIPLFLSYKNTSALDTQLDSIHQKINQPAKEAKLILDPEGNLEVNPSEDGLELDKNSLLGQIENYLTFKATKPSTLPIIASKAKFNTPSAIKSKQYVESLKATPIELKFEDKKWSLDQKTFLSLLNQNTGGEDPNLKNSNLLTSEPKISEETISKIESEYGLDKDRFLLFLENISSELYVPAHDAKFSYDDASQRVIQFQSAQEGKSVSLDKTANLITKGLDDPNLRQITLPVETTTAKISTESVNNFGITGLLGQGVSYFSGSIENRIYNLKLAASRVNGKLIAPGEMFSFNNTVGDISGATGYKPAYVIKSGRTVLDDGGGVCQVSTTLFRAVLNSGLPIVERNAHAYRVGYYEQNFPPGIDATIFIPSVDFKFKNDTADYILIQSYTQGSALYFDLYGKPDGRVATLTTPKILNQTPPPAELRQDDPTIPKGTVKQVDWAAWGANVSFSRTVTRGEEVLINETWKSNYRPWQAVFLVGTKES